MAQKKWENYAYIPDKSADTSFVLSTEGLADNTIYMLNHDASFTSEHDRLVSGMQGLLNRDFGMDYGQKTALYVFKSDTDMFWLDYCRRNGAVHASLNVVVLDTFDEFFDTFINQFKQCGYITWDANVPATSNAALTICGIEGYLPVLEGSEAEEYLISKGIEKKMSLIGMFTGEGTIPDCDIPSTGSTKCDTYLWLLEKYMDRCSANYIAYTLDGACCIKSNPISTANAAYVNCIENHDYLVARRCFCFDLAPYKGEAPIDDPTQPVGTDYATLCKILQRRFDRANGEIGQIFGFPPWWQKYTGDIALRDGTKTGSKPAVWNEWLFTEIVTCYNLAKEADAAHPASMPNGSFYYKYRFLTKEFKNNRPTKRIMFDPNVKYYTIFMGDYDSSAWLRNHTLRLWADEARGQIDLMWAYNPNLSYRVPMVFDYVYENKTPCDHFTAGDSGAGYVMPSGLFEGQYMDHMGECRPACNGDARDKWEKYCRDLYEFFDMDITGFIINGANKMIPEVKELFSRFAKAGNLYNAIDFDISNINGVNFVACYPGFVHFDDYEDMYKLMFEWMEKYNFAAYRTICHSPTNVKKAVDGFTAYAAEKGKKVQYVDMYTFFDLIDQSGQGYKLD